MGVQFSTDEIQSAKRFQFWRDAVCDAFVQLDCEALSDRPFEGEIDQRPLGEASLTKVRSRDHYVSRTPQRIRNGREETVLIQFQAQGRGLVIQDGREAAIGPGDFACYDSVRPYTLKFDDDFDAIVLHMPRDKLVSRVGVLERLTARTVRGAEPLGALAASFLGNLDAVTRQVAPSTASRLYDIALDLISTALGEIIIEQPDVRSWSRTTLVYRAKHLIEEHLDNCELNTDRVARLLGISPRYLQELFQDEGATVSDWMWSRRLERAKRELGDPLHQARYISQIALDVGFSNFGHFSRRFKAAYDMSPREYRQRAFPFN